MCFWSWNQWFRISFALAKCYVAHSFSALGLSGQPRWRGNLRSSAPSTTATRSVSDPSLPDHPRACKQFSATPDPRGSATTLPLCLKHRAMRRQAVAPSSILLLICWQLKHSCVSIPALWHLNSSHIQKLTATNEHRRSPADILHFCWLSCGAAAGWKLSRFVMRTSPLSLSTLWRKKSEKGSERLIKKSLFFLLFPECVVLTRGHMTSLWPTCCCSDSEDEDSKRWPAALTARKWNNSVGPSSQHRATDGGQDCRVTAWILWLEMLKWPDRLIIRLKMVVVWLSFTTYLYRLAITKGPITPRIS